MKTVVIGIGNEYRHDDAAGIEAVAHLRRQVGEPPGVAYAESDGEPTALIDLWTGADLVIVIDGVRPQGDPGRVYRVGLHHPAASRPGAASSHGAPLGDAVALARALDRMPGQMLVYGIQAADVTLGQGLSVLVELAIDTVVAEIAALLEQQSARAR